MSTKSHFKFTKQQRNGIFLLLLIIVAIQCFYFFASPKLFSSEGENLQINDKELKVYLNEIDSLKQAKIEDGKPKIFPFNPNFITDYKGYTLGLSTKEIDRLHNFRKQDKWINSVKQFQQVTKVSDSTLARIRPYFKFPDWVTNPKPKQSSYSSNSFSKTPKTETQKTDLNTATAEQLQKVYGIGPSLSKRIITLRKKLKGFASFVELKDVYGLTPEVAENLKKDFNIKTPRAITKINLNTATRDDLVTIKHIDYEIAYNIIEARTLRDGFKMFDELIKVKGFPINKFEIIKLSLTLN